MSSMSKLLWSSIKIAPAIVGAFFLAIQSASAAPEETSKVELAENLMAQAASNPGNGNSSTQMLEQPGELNRMDGQLDESESMDQVTSVQELKDVSPTEWAYEALQSLVERYGCIVGYPDQTYRGNRALTRWEFAAGLNACMNTMERLIQENVAVLKEDIDTLKRLAQEFEAELAALGGRVDNLEGRVAFLEDNQFSTTTKLRGEAIFSVADTFGEDDDTQTVFQDRVRLNLETSFTGKDLLRTRLQAGNFGGNRFDVSNTGTNVTRLAYDDGSNNDITIDDLWYRFPLFDDKLTVWVGANALNLDDVFNTVSPYLADGGTGSLSRIGRYNNMVYRGPSGAGLGFRFDISDQFYVGGAYLASDNSELGASSPDEGSGLFNGSYSAGGQIGFKPTEDIELAATFVHTFRTGNSDISDNQGLFGNISDTDAEFPFGRGIPTAAERIGLSASWKITDRIHLGAWGGYAIANEVSSAIGLDSRDIWTWNANVSILDLGKEGAVLSLSGGMPPRGEFQEGTVEDPLTGETITVPDARRVDDPTYLIQAQYKFPINDNISITPGAYVVLNPNQNDDNDAIWVGVIRTTFKF
ncbi:putative S-layer protein [Pleurocapsa sp. PCC 7327]|nr:putative S-layer protein [Pleurocapsa sp. PCC 7327]